MQVSRLLAHTRASFACIKQERPLALDQSHPPAVWVDAVVDGRLEGCVRRELNVRLCVCVCVGGCLLLQQLPSAGVWACVEP
jgi:hypothetical protein